MGFTGSQYNRKATTAVNHLLNPCIIYIILGFLAGTIAFELDQLEFKYLIAFLAGTFFLGIILIINNRQRTFNFLLTLFALSLPVNLDINFLYRWHTGGAYGITISLPIIIAFILLLYMKFVHNPCVDSLAVSTFRYEAIIFWPPLIYVASGILSLVNAIYADLVVFELFRMATLILILFLTMNLRCELHIRILIIFLALGLIFQAGLGCVQYKTGKTLGLLIFGEEKLVEQYLGFMAHRATGTIGHPNFYAGYLEILMPLVFAMFLVTRNIWERLLFLVALLTGLAGLLISLSRGAWMATAISFFPVFFVVYKGKLLRNRTAINISVAGIIVLIALYLAYPLIEKRVTHTDYGSAAMRRPLNEAAFSVVKRFPILGVGMNNHSEVLSRYDTTGKSGILHGDKQPVHNLYLLIWTEVGTIGFLAFLWIFFSTFLVAGKLQYKVSLWYRGLLVGIVAGLFSHLMHGLVDQGFKASLLLSILVYALIGLVGAVSISHKRNYRANKMSSEI